MPSFKRKGLWLALHPIEKRQSLEGIITYSADDISEKKEPQ